MLFLCAPFLTDYHWLKGSHKTHGKATRRPSVMSLAAGKYREVHTLRTLKGHADHRLYSCKSSVDSTFCRPVVTAARAVLTPLWLLLNWLVARAPPMILYPLGEFFFFPGVVSGSVLRAETMLCGYYCWAEGRERAAAHLLL